MPAHKRGAASASLTISSSSNTAIPAVALSGEGRPHVPPVLSSLLLTSTAFPAAHSGASAVSAAATGTYLIYSDSQAGTATFTVLQKTAGVYHGSGSSRACGRAPQHRSRTARRCTYESALGSFTHADAAGTNALRFTGRVKGRTLAAGAYTLSAVATSGEGSSSARTAAFKITR